MGREGLRLVQAWIDTSLVDRLDERLQLEGKNRSDGLRSMIEKYVSEFPESRATEYSDTPLSEYIEFVSFNMKAIGALKTGRRLHNDG